MKVGAYVSGYEPDSGGGYTFETDVLDGLVSAARESRHRFCVLSVEGAVEALRARLAGSGIEVHPVVGGWLDRWSTALLRDSAFLRAHWRSRSPLDRAASEVAVDLIWFLGAGAHLTDLPYVTVVWDVQHRATPWFPEMSARGLWDGRELANGWFLRRASAVITGTQTGREELERFYQIHPDRIRILPHPTPRFALDAPDTGPEPGVLQRLGLHAEYVLYPAQFWPHKNHANLVHALALLRSVDAVDVQLALVGSDKGNRAHIESIARKLGVSDLVRFLGFVSREDLIALYRNALALTYASWCGPENLPPLEAFALGCPVIAGRIPGADEQLGVAALLVNPGNPADIALAIKKVRADKALRANLLAAGLERARRWTARDYVRGVFSFLDQFEPVIRCWRPT